jgi:hypothetical protein
MDLSFLREKVEAQLACYEHPLFEFSCRESKEGIDLMIGMKIPGLYDGIYSLELKERDIMDTQFAWAFQRLLYNCLHDYVVEMFEKTPQSRSV